MITKMLEIRDRGTKIPCIAISTSPQDINEECFWQAEGFGYNDIILVRCEQQESHYDPFAWKDTRTMRNAHLYIREHFTELHNFDVVDVEFILKEKASPSETEIWSEENQETVKIAQRLKVLQ
ncbi:MAG: hypothetical protein NC218_02115 [Acetobacter sp.]|nr:hypothetical protein [Acetobacter sp.]